MKRVVSIPLLGVDSVYFVIIRCPYLEKSNRWMGTRFTAYRGNWFFKLLLRWTVVSGERIIRAILQSSADFTIEDFQSIAIKSSEVLKGGKIFVLDFDLFWVIKFKPLDQIKLRSRDGFTHRCCRLVFKVICGRGKSKIFLK